MNRLSRYLARLFAADAMALFAVALFLLFLIQCLRSFDVVSVKGQDLLTLVGQALLTMPTLGVVFLYVCLAIGLARGLRGLQLSQELHIIHASRRTSALFAAIALYTAGGAIAALILTNFVEPATNRRFNEWSASIAADLVGRTLTPHRFAEVVPGVTMVIGGRLPGGELTDFFADDNRNPTMRRTYIARSATVASDSEGYVLQLRDGALQYMSADRQFSEISFARYDVALERLTGAAEERERIAETNSLDLIGNAIAAGGMEEASLRALGQRLGEGLRVVALCLFVAAIAAFPSGRRRFQELPLEIVVLAAAFLERGISSNLFAGSVLPLSGSMLMIVGCVVVLLIRSRIFTRLPARAVPA